MRIGIMLRALDEKGGISVYAHNITKELLRRDQDNDYVLLYSNPANLGLFGHHNNAKELLVRSPHRVLWDQFGVPAACRREKIDLIFHPKFTAPLPTSAKVVMVVHGADWFVPEQAQYYSRFNVAYMWLMMPLFFRKCSAVISVSQLTTDNFKRVFAQARDKIRTVYFAPARQFRPVTDRKSLEEVAKKYQLPDEFILTLSKRSGDVRKNLRGVLEGYQLYHQQVAAPHRLVIGGKDCHLFREEYDIPASGYGRDVLFPGWIDQKDLPAVYSLATLYLYPSNLEAFPIPVTEAMACGTPVVTSDANGLREIAGNAALFVNPNDSKAIAQALVQVTSKEDVRADLSGKGLVRSRDFSWDKCADQTLEILERSAQHAS